MDPLIPSELDRSQRHSLSALRHTALVVVVLAMCLAACAPGICQAKETCPWLNEATAAGFLNTSATSSVTHPNKNKGDATCEFIHRDGSVLTELRIEVETMSGPPATFASYAARCGSNASPLTAIGNEAVACGSDGKKGQLSEQVVGRVRDRAFIVLVSSNADLSDRDVLRNKARKVAEQVAGFLF
jgi:hypothetical protein